MEISGQYLKLTKDKGLILRPTICEERGELLIDCYVDADFARLWGYEDRNDPLLYEESYRVHNQYRKLPRNLEEQVTILYCLFHYGGRTQCTVNGDA
jgi:hypothetical protein